MDRQGRAIDNDLIIRNGPPYGLGGFDPACGPRHFGKAAKWEISCNCVAKKAIWL